MREVTGHKIVSIKILFLFLTFVCYTTASVDLLTYGTFARGTDSESVQEFQYRGVPLYSHDLMLPDNDNIYGPLSFYVSPMTTMQFGDFDDPVQSRLGVVAHIDIELWKGSAFDLRYAFPLYNEIDSSKIPFPTLVAVRQLFGFRNNSYLQISSGLFSSNRWGADLSWRHNLLKKSLLFSANVGVTGYSKFVDSTFIYTELNRISGEVGVSHFYGPFRVISSLSLGRYLEKDLGGTIELRRVFQHAEVYLFLSLTEIGHNGGFGILLPLWKRRPYPSLKGVKLGPYRNFDWRYMYRGIEPPGHRYNTGSNLDFYLKHLHPQMSKKKKVHNNGDFLK